MTYNTEMQIPRDILEAAWACVDQYTDPDLVPVIAMALVRERERCARIAESVGNYGGYKREELTKDYGQPRFDLMHEIVAAIRGSVDK